MKLRIAGAVVALLIGCRALPPPIELPLEASVEAVHDRVVPASGQSPSENAPRPGTPFPAPDFTQPLGVADAVAYGLANNPRLREASARIDVAQEGETIAHAAYLPEIGTSHRYSAFDTPVIPGGNFVPASLTGGAYAYYLGELGVRWTLYDFGRTAGRFGQAVARTEIERQAQARARQAVAFEVARGCFRLLFAEAVLRVREEAVRQAEAVLADTKARRAGGVADRESVLRAEVELSQAREELVAGRQLVEDARANLNFALGRPAQLPLAIRPIGSPPSFDRPLEACLERAAAARPEIGLGRAAVAEAAYGAEAAHGELLPNIFIRGTVIRADSPGPIEGWSTGAGIHLDQPLYGGGKRLAELRRQRARGAVATATLQTVLDEISQQVCIAHQAIAPQRERIRLGETAVAQATENLRLTVVKYKNGDATPTEVVDAQTARTRAATRYHSAICDYLEAIARLEYAQGGAQEELLQLLACDPH